MTNFKKPTKVKSRLRVLRTEDKGSAFHRSESAAEILTRLGPPRSLLSSSAKTHKSAKVGVLSKILYMPSGIFCPAASDACRKSCLGHTSGHMGQQRAATARDRRAALYLEDQNVFMTMLRGELWSLAAEAHASSLIPAMRLNGASDVVWELLHREIFDEFPMIQFYDYTKMKHRMMGDFLEGRIKNRTWPANYHLCFSGDGNRPEHSCEVLQAGGTVALVFWPELPTTWLGSPVVDGDEHDARFLDPKGHIIGLRAKGVARVDADGFVIRPCPTCGPLAEQMMLIRETIGTHRELVHVCNRCSRQVESRWAVSHRDSSMNLLDSLAIPPNGNLLN